MSASGGISARFLSGLVSVIEARGLDADTLLASARIDRSMARSTKGRISYVAVDTLIENLAKKTPAAGLGLALSAAQDETAYGPAGLLLLTAGTFRRGLKLSIGYQRLWGDGDRFSIGEEHGQCRVTFRHPGKSKLSGAIFAECALAEIAAGARALVGADANAVAVEFTHAPLGDDRLLREHFGIAPGYGHRENAIVLSPDVADRPLHVLRDVLSRALENQARRLLEGLPASTKLAERVRDALDSAWEQSPTLASIARRLGMSPRTLQRRLSDEGTNFERLRDLERQARADALIRDGAQLKQAALDVGFADPSALARARRRWTRNGTG
jgi:AraC-like DNA-binding protein